MTRFMVQASGRRPTQYIQHNNNYDGNSAATYCSQFDLSQGLTLTLTLTSAEQLMYKDFNNCVRVRVS